MPNDHKATAEKDRIVTINWPALWCLVFFILGFVAGRLW